MKNIIYLNGSSPDLTKNLHIPKPKNMYKLIWLLVLLLAITSITSAQSLMITGIVTDENGNRLVGATFQLKGGSLGTTTFMCAPFGSCSTPEASSWVFAPRVLPTWTKWSWLQTTLGPCPPRRWLRRSSNPMEAHS